MSAEASRTAIGISFGNSYSSIAYTSPVDGKPEVIANEEGKKMHGTSVQAEQR